MKRLYIAFVFYSFVVHNSSQNRSVWVKCSDTCKLPDVLNVS